MTTSVGLILYYQIMSKHFKMYIMITDTIGKKRIDLAYPIQGKEVAVVGVFSDNIRYKFTEPRMLGLGESRIKRIMAGTYTR